MRIPIHPARYRIGDKGQDQRGDGMVDLGVTGNGRDSRRCHIHRDVPLWPWSAGTSEGEAVVGKIGLAGARSAALAATASTVGCSCVLWAACRFGMRISNWSQPTAGCASVHIAHCTSSRQRNGGAKDVIRIVLPLGFDEPVGIGTIASCHPVRVVSGKEVRISTRKRHRSEGLTSGSSPLAMPLLLFLVRGIDERGEDLDQHVVAAEPEGRCL